MVAAVAVRGRGLLFPGRRTPVEHEGKHVEILESNRGAIFATCASLPSLTLRRNLEEGPWKKSKEEVV